MSHHPTISVCYAKPNKRTAYRSLIIIWSTPTLTVTALANWRWQACESPSTDTPYMLLLMKHEGIETKATTSQSLTEPPYRAA